MGKTKWKLNYFVISCCKMNYISGLQAIQVKMMILKTASLQRHRLGTNAIRSALCIPCVVNILIVLFQEHF